MEILRLLVGPFTTYVIGPIAKKFQVSRHLEDNIEELERTKTRLDGKRRDEEGKLIEANKQEGVEASAEANRWFTQVREAVSNVDNLKADYEDHQRRRRGLACHQCLPNCFCCFTRYKLSKRALKLKQVVENLYEEELKSGWTAASTSQKGVRALDTVSIEGQSTREKLKSDIIDAVVDDGYVVVGLHGMGGVGKTTLIRHAYNYFRHTDHFKSVIFTTVSATPNYVEIRKEIARTLGLRVEKDEDDKDVKQKLSRLSSSNIGKYLLILDDMLEMGRPPVDIGEICIPAPNRENGCKILTASRSSSVVTNFVIRFAARDSLKLIAVNSLPPKEAWNLFVQKVGEEITCKPEIKPLAKKIVRKCDGLPLAITVVGGTMATRQTEGEWNNAVHELEQSASKIEGIIEQVFSKLIFSFEKLQPIEQSLFLYCCLFPEDYSMDKKFFHNFAVGEETLVWDEMQDELGDVKNGVDVLIGKLRNSSMLEDEGDGDVRMHDVMRELALWITSSNEYHSTTKLKFIAKAGGRTSKAPHASEWSQANKISLMFNNQMESLPELPHLCPQLHTLLLRSCFGIKEIPQVNFLERMPALRILDLNFTGVEYLPPSMSYLVNLRSLCLSECYHLKELPPEIGMLVQLISLDLSNCRRLKKLPMEMQKLKNLRHLDIRRTKKWIPRGVLSGLHKLEELRARKLDSNGIMELSQLTRLTNARINTIIIKKVKVSHWLKRLCKATDSLLLRNCQIDPSALSDGLLEDPVDFHRQVVFISCKGLTRAPGHGCFCLTVYNCPDLRALLMVEEERRNIDAFQILDELTLVRLDELETICIGIPQPGCRCFTNLREINILDCPNLKVLFTKGVTRLLTKLKELHVHRCSQLVKLAVSDDDDDAFPILERISLCELPELTAICDLDLKWSSLSTAHIYLCPKLRGPPFGARRADVSLNDEIDSQMTQDYFEHKRTQEEEEEKLKEEEEEKEEEEDEDEDADDDDDDWCMSP